MKRPTFERCNKEPKVDIKQAIEFNFRMADFVVNAYLTDLDDKDLLVRPVPGANHIAWQLGHLIFAERYMVERVAPGSMDPLPEDFERYGRGSAATDNPEEYLSKEAYLELAKKVRAGTLRVVERLSPADLDQPVTQIPPFAKNAGEALLTVGGHWLMHVGQWAMVRRKIGRPPLF
jgi:hypothetical protein